MEEDRPIKSKDHCIDCTITILRIDLCCANLFGSFELHNSDLTLFLHFLVVFVALHVRLGTIVMMCLYFSYLKILNVFVFLFILYYDMYLLVNLCCSIIHIVYLSIFKILYISFCLQLFYLLMLYNCYLIRFYCWGSHVL